MLIELDYVMCSIDTVGKLTAKVRQECEQMPDGPDKEKLLCVMQGQDVGLDGVLKLLKIHPEHGKCVTEWMPPHPKLPRIIRRGTEQR
jgi:hypothetical protein